MVPLECDKGCVADREGSGFESENNFSRIRNTGGVPNFILKDVC
jgi:hypothetical protein